MKLPIREKLHEISKLDKILMELAVFCLLGICGVVIIYTESSIIALLMIIMILVIIHIATVNTLNI